MERDPEEQHNIAERQPPAAKLLQRVRHDVTFSERRFDVNTLPDDMRRVYGHLERQFGEEYGLLFIFTMRTAVELHRAWNMASCSQKVFMRALLYGVCCIVSENYCKKNPITISSCTILI